MIGSHLLGQQPTFAGGDFGIPEVALFGYYQFRNAVPTSDTWEEHAGAEFLFMQSGEACWDLPEDHFWMVSGNQAVIFPAGQRHRIANGIYTPCRLFWIVFDEKEIAKTRARLFLPREIDALFEMAADRERPVDLPVEVTRSLTELCLRLVDERLLIGSAAMIAEVRSRLYSIVIAVWDLCISARSPVSQSRLVRQAAALLRIEAGAAEDGEQDDRIEEIARKLGYSRSHLYGLFAREVGMAPNDYRQRLRIKRCCARLVQTEDAVIDVALDAGFHSSQYFARVFRKYVGVTPSNYRHLFRSNGTQRRLGP